jgi:hypothetical protein
MLFSLTKNGWSIVFRAKASARIVDNPFGVLVGFRRFSAFAKIIFSFVLKFISFLVVPLYKRS